MARFLSNILTLLFVVLLAAGHIADSGLLLAAAVIGALAVTAIQWATLARIGKIFSAVALVSTVLFAIFNTGHLDRLQTALIQGVGFAALLAMLGILRHPVRRSPLVAQATAWLLAFPDNRRYAAVNAGSYFLSLLFNIGVIALIGDLTRDNRPDSRDLDSEDRNLLVLAGMRGAALMTAWSPMGLGFAIVITSIPALDIVEFVVLAFVLASVLLAITCAFELRRHKWKPVKPAEEALPRQSAKPMIKILIACGVLLALTLVLHEWLDISFIIGAVIALPLFSVAWFLLERGPSPNKVRDDLRLILTGADQMKTEGAVFLSASVIGAIITDLIREHAYWSWLQHSTIPLPLLLIGCMLLVVISAAAYIPHSVFVLMLAQLFGTGPLGAEHPAALGMALLLGWAIAISISPISAMSLIAARVSGTPSHVIGFKWNRSFALLLLGLSSLIVLVLSLA